MPHSDTVAHVDSVEQTVHVPLLVSRYSPVLHVLRVHCGEVYSPIRSACAFSSTHAEQVQLALLVHVTEPGAQFVDDSHVDSQRLP